MKAATRLKHPFYLQRDYTEEERRVRGMLLKLRWACKEKGATGVVLRDTALLLDGQRYYLDRDDQLCYGSGSRGEQYLDEKYGIRIYKLWNRMRSYNISATSAASSDEDEPAGAADD